MCLCVLISRKRWRLRGIRAIRFRLTRERYNASGGEGTALCGIFQEILRASVNNFLFLWRFDKWDGHCPEYSGEEQTICAVGLAKAKPGRDGHVSELLYSTASWWHKRCCKVYLTSGLGSAISRWVVPNVFKFGAVDPIVEMVNYNESRKVHSILYARTKELKVQVYVLGIKTKKKSSGKLSSVFQSFLR
ncbi:hypothetical protein QQ045_010009 [Rhodiola kirilowii]